MRNHERLLLLKLERADRLQISNVVAVVAVVIVILCNLASCIYHRVLAKDDTKNFLIINVFNGHLAIFYQITSLVFLILLFCEMTEVEKNETLSLLEKDIIQMIRFCSLIILQMKYLLMEN